MACSRLYDFHHHRVYFCCLLNNQRNNLAVQSRTIYIDTFAPVLSYPRHPAHLCSMSRQIITISRMLKLMEEGHIFSCTYVSYDRQRRKGGNLKRIEEGVLVQGDAANTNKPRLMTKAEHYEAIIATRGKRAPNHKEWYTRNVRLCVSGHPTSVIKKIHPPIIIEFNNLTVVP